MAQQEERQDEPRYGVRATPAEVEQRRGAGATSPGAGSQSTAPGPLPQEPASRGRHAAPVTPEEDPYRTAPAQARARRRDEAPGAPRRPGGLASPPPGGWSWQTAGAGPARPRRRGRGMLVLGLILLIVVPVALLVGAVRTAVDGSLSVGAVVGASGTVYLEQDTGIGLYSSQSTTDVAACIVTAPSGASVTTQPLPAQMPQLPYASFTAPETGRYTVSCPDGAEVVVGPALRVEQAPRAGLMVMAAMGSGLVGALLSVVAVVRLVRSGRSADRS